MKKLAHIVLTQISTTKYSDEKLYLYLFSPLKAGVLGFSIIMIILFFGDFLCSSFGIQRLTLNGFDVLLAGIGFLLKFGENLLKNFQW
jgi:hypothetical protein